MITCGTRCEPDASGPSDQSTAAAAAPYALFSGDRRSFKKSCCRILRCVALCCACERASEGGERAFGGSGGANSVYRIQFLLLLRGFDPWTSSVWDFGIFVFWRVGWGVLANHFLSSSFILVLPFFKFKFGFFFTQRALEASSFNHPNQGFFLLLFFFFSFFSSPNLWCRSFGDFLK